jgi:hypothetical protein
VLPANAGQVAEVVRYCAAHTLNVPKLKNSFQNF